METGASHTPQPAEDYPPTHPRQQPAKESRRTVHFSTSPSKPSKPQLRLAPRDADRYRPLRPRDRPDNKSHKHTSSVTTSSTDACTGSQRIPKLTAQPPHSYLPSQRTPREKHHPPGRNSPNHLSSPTTKHRTRWPPRHPARFTRHFNQRSLPANRQPTTSISQHLSY